MNGHLVIGKNKWTQVDADCDIAVIHLQRHVLAKNRVMVSRYEFLQLAASKLFPC